MGSIEIAEYTKRDLKELLADESFWMQPKLPITKRRVVSHVANPRADDNDTVRLPRSTKTNWWPILASCRIF